MSAGPVLDREQLPPAGQSDVCLFSADSSYFLDFADIPLRSATEAGWDVHFHFHVMNPTPEALDRAAMLRKQFPMSVSFADVPPSKALYASGRYLIAEQVMQHCDRPIWIMDIDLAYEDSPSELFGSMGWRRDALGLRYTDDLALPWQRMTANAMYVPPTGQGRAYLGLVAHFLKLHLLSGPVGRDLWWVDQNALIFALLETSERYSEPWQVWGPRLPRILRLPELYKPSAQERRQTLTSPQ
ncbi:MAG: hypothetical protein K0U64_02770 [Actinomycetia bacterium]|nr:hypothetical protein [Actinomycetes bacterium]